MIIVLNGKDSLTNFIYGWVYNSDNYSNAVVVMDVSLKSPEMICPLCMRGCTVSLYCTPLYVHLAEAMNNDPIIKELTSFISFLLGGILLCIPLS